MESKKSILSILVAVVFILSSISVFGQTNRTPVKIKSKIVHEEKTVKGGKSTSIESEEKYDQNGNVIDEIQYKDGKVDKHMVYEYDTENNKIRETEFDSSGKVKKIGEYVYQDGLRTEKKIYDGNKKLISKKTYTYIFR